MQQLSEQSVNRALEWAWETVIDGSIPGFSTAGELAVDFRRTLASPTDAATSLVRWQTSKAGVAGFATGLGGLLTLPVSVPANLASVLVIQLRMVAAVAILGGHDVRSDQVKTLAYACLVGKGVTDVLKQGGVQLGNKLGVAAVGKVSGATLTKINQAVGFRLVTKFGETGLINLGKLVPFIGGPIGGTFDSVQTWGVGQAAIKLFLGQEPVPAQA
jgi:hypothetical protein